MRVVQEVSAKRSVGMLLSGDAGQGKTHLAVAKECLVYGLCPVYIKPEVLNGNALNQMIERIPVWQRAVWIVDDCNSPYGQMGELFLRLTIVANQRGDALLVTSNTDYQKFTSTIVSQTYLSLVTQVFLDQLFSQKGGTTQVRPGLFSSHLDLFLLLKILLLNQLCYTVIHPRLVGHLN